MKQLVLGGGAARLEEVPRPEAEPGWAVIRAMVLPICGSDRGAFLDAGEHRYAGHEGTGVVDEVTPGSRFEPGDRVVIAPQAGCGCCRLCRSGEWIYCGNRPEFTGHFREYVKKQEWILPRLPEDISLEVGSLAGCALCPAFSALEIARVTPSDTVLVTGLGPVGLGAVAVASLRGARVLAVEPQAYRRDLAMQLGADEVTDPAQEDALEWARELTDGQGPSCAVECSGGTEPLRLCIDAAATLGRVAIVGENHGPVEMGPSEDFIRKGLTVFGTWFGNWLNYAGVFDVIRRKPDVAKIITHTFAFERAQEAFQTFFSGEAGKVLLTPGG
ncbi:MAG: zinc-binding dehydrogenase [Candidatus Brocadiaceae bacterium]